MDWVAGKRPSGTDRHVGPTIWTLIEWTPRSTLFIGFPIFAPTETQTKPQRKLA